MIRILPLLISLALTACSTCSSPKPLADQPELAVQAYFSALERGDCEALREAAGGKLAERIEKAGCDAALNDNRTRGLRFVRIEGMKPDGRNRNVMIASVVVLRDGEEAEVLLRIEKEGERWKLASL